MALSQRTNGAVNPFKMPNDEEVFVLRDEEKRQKLRERDEMAKRSVQEKTTWSARIGSAKLKSDVDDLDIIKETRPEAKTQHAEVAYPQVEKRVKDNMTKYIVKKRKMGLARMSLATKRAEVRKLDEEAQRAEKRIGQQEEQIKETQGRFRSFLQHSDMEQDEAFRAAEKETKEKQDMINDIKRLTAQIAQVETDRKKNADEVEAYLQYKTFLDSLTPASFFRDQLIKIRTEDTRAAIADETDMELNELAAEAAANDTVVDDRDREMIMARMTERVEQATETIQEEVSQMTDKEAKEELDVCCDESRVDMYFTKPEQIQTKFIEIEEGNLFLINTCQELEVEIEEVEAKAQKEEHDMAAKMASARAQMDAVMKKILDEDAKNKALQERLDQAESASGEDEVAKKREVEAKVTAIYLSNASDRQADQANLRTLGKLTAIEVKLEQLRQEIINLSIDKATISRVMKDNFKKRRQESRQIQINKKAEDRKKRSEEALARAVGEVKKRVGKPVMARSRPPDMRTKESNTDAKQEQDEDDQYFY